MSHQDDISPLALNRISVYLRCLRQLQEQEVHRISSKEMAHRFHLSAAQIRKDLAYFGEFGIRGVGYDVAHLRERLEKLLGVEREHPAIIVGAGRVGTALAQFPGFRTSSFRILGLFDNDPRKVGTRQGELTVRHSRELGTVVADVGAEIAILTVPAEAAQENYDALVAAGIKAVLNFAPVQLELDPRVRAKTVDLTIFLEELAYFLR
ncbi:MAG: redox-sensing transcriptional repressor Rex [bacterium]|nr:redox-sensing transcriptional repressor Rex [bacterium]